VPTQLSFFKTATRRPIPAALPRPTTNAVVTYFAVLPPAEIQGAIIRLRQETVKRERIFGRAVALERLHISIAPLHRYAPTDIPDLERLATDIVSGVAMSAFDVRFDRVQTFNTKDRDEARRRYYLVLDSQDAPGLMRLNDLFRQSLARHGLSAAMPKAFNPHMTLFYANRPVAPHDISPIRWTVRDVALVRSGLVPGRYDVLKRWPLAARSNHLPVPKIGGE